MAGGKQYDRFLIFKLTGLLASLERLRKLGQTLDQLNKSSHSSSSGTSKDPNNNKKKK